jgi:hypothetical protein
MTLSLWLDSVELSTTHTKSTKDSSPARIDVSSGNGRARRTYREFWPYYLREHAQPATRGIHFAGTGLATASLIALIATRNPQPG